MLRAILVKTIRAILVKAMKAFCQGHRSILKTTFFFFFSNQWLQALLQPDALCREMPYSEIDKWEAKGVSSACSAVWYHKVISSIAAIPTAHSNWPEVPGGISNSQVEDYASLLHQSFPQVYALSMLPVKFTQSNSPCFKLQLIWRPFKDVFSVLTLFLSLFF